MSKYNNKIYCLIILFVILLNKQYLKAAIWDTSTWDSTKSTLDSTYILHPTKYREYKIDTRYELSISSAYSDKLPNSHIAIAYGGATGVYYATYDTLQNKWQITEVEKTVGGVGREISLQIDNNGLPHISYMDWDKQYLKYAYYDEVGWHIQTLDNSPEIGRFNVLQLDKDENPHIAYYDSKNGAIKYIYFNNNTWKKEIIDIADKKVLGLYISFKIDKENKRHISYYDATDKNLKYAYYNGEKWLIEKIDTTGIAGMFSDVCLDKNNRPHISYFSNKILKYAYKQANNQWLYEIVDTTFENGMYKTKIIIDNEDNKHIFYKINYPYIQNTTNNSGRDMTNYGYTQQIKYANYKNGQWEIENVKDGDFTSFDVANNINNKLWMVFTLGEIYYLGPKNIK